VLLPVTRTGERRRMTAMHLAGRSGRHAVVRHVLLRGLVGMLVHLRRMPARALCLVGRRLVVARTVRLLGRAVVFRRALVMGRGLTVVLCAFLTHVLSGTCDEVTGSGRRVRVDDRRATGAADAAR